MHAGPHWDRASLEMVSATSLVCPGVNATFWKSHRARTREVATPLQPVKVQLWNRAGGPRAGVCNRDGEGQAVYFFGLCVLGRLQKPVGKEVYVRPQPKEYRGRSLES